MAKHTKHRKLRHSDVRPDAARAEPIAIVGIGCRFPGGADSPEALWLLMRDGVDAITSIPADRPELSALYDSTPGSPGKIVTEQGGFLSNLDQFDPIFFGISPREAKYIDPQQRLLLEVTWEAFEDAGIVPAKVAARGVGVFIGMWTSDYEDRMYDATSDIDLYITTGGGRYSASGRLSYVFDLRGPSMTVDTACSSSLVAAHLACQSLRTGECELAIAGGANLILKPYISIGYSRSKILSPDGRCRFGDADANGYVRSEGVGVVLLKRLSQALVEGDPIYAVIRGSAVNNDGQSSGVLVAPGIATQEIMLRQAYRNAGVDPKAVQYVEAHGTGTSIGDPVEVAALGVVLGENRHREMACLMGSVKTNIGHTEAASGIAGLIKVALCLKRREIPPSLHLKTPNPKIPWQKLSMRVQREHGLWPAREGSAFAAVNSFGITGTNAHVVLQEAPISPNAGARTQKDSRRSHLLPLSAHNGEALRDLTDAYRILLSDNDQKEYSSLNDICFTASVKRTHHRCRLAVAGHSYEELVDRLEAVLRRDDSQSTFSCAVREGPQRLAFVFSGQGPQWFAMGRELLRQEPVFREAIEQCDVLLGKLAGWSLMEEFHRNEANSRFGETQFAQPAIFALQVGLAALWRSWGIIPDAVVGHSVGEVAAAHVAGALTLQDAVAVIYHRGRLMQQGTGKGKMVSVELSAAEARNVLLRYTDHLAVAAINSPITTVLSGESDALNEVIQCLEARNVASHILPVNYAFHSPQMEPYRIDLVQALKGLKARATSIPMISTVKGEFVQDGSLNPSYWGRNVREPVRFADAIGVLLADGVTTFVEISPHPVLAAAIAQCAGECRGQVTLVPSLRRGQEERLTMLTALGELYSAGRNFDWGKLYQSGGRLVKLPSYPWQRQRYWIDEQTSAEKMLPTHPQEKLEQSGTQSQPRDWFYRIAWEPRPRQDQTNPDGRLTYLPAPIDIVADLRSRAIELGAQHGLPQFVAVWPHLQDLSVAYALRTLQRLGWDDRPVAREALPEQLGIVERHRRFFDRLLGMLEEAGMLDGRDDKWKLLPSPKFDHPKLRAQDLLREYPECRIELKLLSRCGERLADVLTNRCDPLQLLFPENDSPSAENLYCDAPFMKTANALVSQAVAAVLNHLPKGMTLRILELGAGTGGTTASILPCLPADRTEYVFTDVSNSFLITAAQKFSSYPFVRYRLLDLEREPASQGFTGGRFDIIIAANVLHATADLTRTVEYVKALLAPRGLLVLVEGTGPQQWLDLIFGTLEGWWRFADKDLRPAHPLISPKEWTRLLAHVGFEEAAVFPDEGEQGLRKQCVIVARGPRAEVSCDVASEWLIFADKRGIADQLVELIAARGEPYILVSAGETFAPVDVKNFEINPANPDDFSRVIAAIGDGKSNALQRIVHLWSLDTTPLENTTAEKLGAEQLLMGGSVIHLVQSLAKDSVKARLWLVSRGAQPVVTKPELLAVTQSPIWGLGRVIALEHPELWGGLIDLEEGSDEAAQVSQLWQEIGNEDPDGEDQKAFRDNQRYVPRLVRGVSVNGEREADIAWPAPRATIFAADSAYLITGGLGRLGLMVAHWMAKRGARHLALVSRRRLPERSTWADLAADSDAYETILRIQGIESLGATVRVVSGDVCDFATMSELFTEFGKSMPSLRGVIHAAGVFNFHNLTEINSDVLKTCLRPKIIGTWVLHELTKHASLDFFVAFSSTASLWGVKGFAHYAAANQFLDAIAHFRKALGLPALTINWGRWSGGGMNGEAEKSATQVGLEAMPAADALEVLGHLLGTSTGQVTVAACNWDVLRPVYEARRQRPLFEKLPSAQRRAVGQQSKKPENFLVRLRQAPSSERTQLLRDFVHDQVAGVLGVNHAQSLDAKQGFFRMGMDSLMSVQLRQRLENSLDGCSLPLTLAFEYPNIEALTRYLAKEVLNLDMATPRVSTPVDGLRDTKAQDDHDRLSEDELVDLLAKKLEQL
jgi:microcystin synthetase protein McyG